MYLTPETTFNVSVNTTFREEGGVQIPTFDVVDGGSVVLRTATGRELAKVFAKMRDTDELYNLLPQFVVGGVDVKRIDDLHPGIVNLLVQEVIKRSRISEVERGK